MFVPWVDSSWFLATRSWVQISQLQRGFIPSHLKTKWTRRLSTLSLHLQLCSLDLSSPTTSHNHKRLLYKIPMIITYLIIIYISSKYKVKHMDEEKICSTIQWLVWGLSDNIDLYSHVWMKKNYSSLHNIFVWSFCDNTNNIMSWACGHNGITLIVLQEDRYRLVLHDVSSFSSVVWCP